MKVLQVIPSVGPLRGGPSFAIRSISRGLAAAGIETHIATTDDNGPGARLDVRTGVPIDDNGVTYWYFPRQFPFYTYSAPFTGWMWGHAANYDLIHIHTLFSYCSNMAAYIASRLGVPYVIRPLGVLNRWGREQRRPWLKRASIALIERHILNGAAFVHYTAEQERAEASECGFCDRPMIIPNPVEIPDGPAQKGTLRRQFPELAGRRILLFLSRIDRKKGLDLLIPAFAGLVKENPGAALVIAGDGDRALMETLKAQCSSLGIASQVFWTGFLSGDAKAGALADADVFVLPSWSENFGIAPIEAMALGVPVIVTDQVGICREVIAGDAGLVTPPAVEPLRQAMARLLADDDRRRVLGRNGAALARAQFAPEVVMKKLSAAYSAVLAASAS